MSRRDREQKANDYLRRATNYSVEALVGVARNAAIHRKQGRAEDAETLNYVSANLREAVKFILPTGGLLFDDTKSWMLQNIHPPFDRCAFEFDLPDGVFSNTDQTYPPSSPDGNGHRVRKVVLLSVRGHETTTLFPIFHSNGTWTNGVFFPVIHDKETRLVRLEDVPEGAKFINDGRHDMTLPEVRKRSFVAFDLRFATIRGAVDKMGLDTEEKLYQRGLLNTQVFLFVFAQACAALECTNVGTEVLRPNREAVKARAPLDSYEYHILTIEPNEERTPSQERGGTHASPRTHLRRGHIRHLSSGKKVWVNSCLVNPGHGMIEKDYVLA